MSALPVEMFDDCDYRYMTPCNRCGETGTWDDIYPEYGRVWFCDGCDASISWEN